MSFNKKIYKGLHIPGISLKLAKHPELTFKILENLQQNFILMINSWKCDILIMDNFVYSIYHRSYSVFMYWRHFFIYRFYIRFQVGELLKFYRKLEKSQSCIYFQGKQLAITFFYRVIFVCFCCCCCLSGMVVGTELYSIMEEWNQQYEMQRHIPYVWLRKKSICENTHS